MYDNPINIALRLLEAATENLSQHYYDDFVEKNADSAVRSGMKSLIIRRQMGNCCEFCASLSGIYDYGSGDYPDKIFTRHENCRCMVTFKTEKGGYTDVWSKIEYESQRDARIAREKEISATVKNEETFIKKKNIARAKGEKFVDATNYYANKPKEYPDYLVVRKGKFEFRGETYKVGDRGIKPIPGDKERKLAEWWCDRFGGEIVFQPRILYPQKIKTPDYLINRTAYDLKSPTGAGKWVIDHQVHEATGQANKVIIDLTDSPLKRQKSEIIRQIHGVFKSNDYEWLENIFIVADKELIYVAERV